MAGIIFCLCQSPSVQSEVRTNFDVKVHIGDASEVHQEDASEHYRQGVNAMGAGNIAQAGRHANRAFKLDARPEHAILLARVFTAKDMKADALRVFNRALHAAKSASDSQHGPRSEAYCALHNNAGILLAEMGDAERGAEQLRKAVSCAEDKSFGHGMRLNLALGEMQRKQWGTCVEQAQMVATQQVGAAMKQAAHVARAVCLFRNGAAHDKIVAETNKAVKALPSKDSAKSTCASIEEKLAKEFAGKKMKAGKARSAALSYEPSFWYMQ
jgi:tetratricopeptide (TPR) repeat protein